MPLDVKLIIKSFDVSQTTVLLYCEQESNRYLANFVCLSTKHYLNSTRCQKVKSSINAIIATINKYKPVADPGFPWGGGANSPGGRQHTILPYFLKSCMKLKEFGSPGGRGMRPPHPPDPSLLKRYELYNAKESNLKMFTHSSIQSKWNYLGGNFMTGIPPQKLTFI